MDATPDWNRNRRRRLAGVATVALVGLALLTVPLYDVWEDVYRQGVVPVSTVVENAVPALLAIVPLGGAGLLYRSGWHERYVLDVARWCIASVCVAVLVMAWVLGIQWTIQHELKPVIVAADTVVAAGAAGVVIGMYSARSERRATEAEQERDRLSALLNNTTDAIATVSLEGERARIEGVNPAFVDTFGVERAAVTGEALGDVLETGAWERDSETFVERASRGESFESEVTRRAADGERSFLMRVIPVGKQRAYVAYTDVTERKELRREVAARNRMEYLHSVASEMAGTDGREEVYALALDGVLTTLDAAAVCLTLDGEAVAAEGTEGPIRADMTRTDLPEEGRSHLVGNERFNTVLVIPAGERGTVQVGANEPDAFDERDVKAVELLAANLGETIARLEREETVEEERERLEFLNRALRHNLLNGMNVVNGRAQVLRGRVEEGYDEHLETVITRTRDMIELVETMRSFMKVVAESEDHEPEPVALRLTLEEEVKKAADAYDADIRTGEIPDVSVCADELLGEVFENLLTNAVRHNDKEVPEVRVTVETDPESVTVGIADNGPGVPDEEKEDIFEKGIKGLQSPGSGFGLYLVNQIVEFYGGEVYVEDNEPEGAVFGVRLPRPE
jgi:PAS domain S-box-containing protein